MKAQQPAFRNYTVDDGLPSSEIYHVIQDSKGYIWLATNMGVSRFDGREFWNFDVQNGLPENTVFEIYEDNIGRLWFVSFPFQLSYFENDSIHSYKYNDKLRELAGHGLVPLKKCFRADTNFNIWFSFLNDGTIYNVNNKGNIRKIIEMDINNASIAIIEIDGQLITAQSGTRKSNTLNIIIKTNDKDLSLDIAKKQTKYSGGYLITEKLSSGEIIFAQNEILTIINTTGEHSSINLNDRILWVSRDSDGSIWVGKEFTGAEKYTSFDLHNHSSPLEQYLKTKSITSILKDNEDGLWFATQGDGVFYLPSKAFISYQMGDGLSGENIKFIEPFQGKLYIGSEDSYFMDVLIKDKIKALKSYGQDKNKIKALTSYKDSMLWIGTEKHLHSFDGKTFKKNVNNHPSIYHKPINSTLVFSIKDIYPVSKSKVLLGQMRSLAIVEDGRVTFDTYYDSDISLRIEAIEKFKEDEFLLGTFNGLWKFKDHDLVYLGKKSKLLQQRITDIVNYMGLYFILATKGSGLIVLKKDTIIQINQSKGLSSNSVTSLLITGNEIWAATNNGLNIIKADKLDDAEPNILVFKKQQGLISNEINQIKGDTNTIYIATNKGLTVFNRKKYQPFKHSPPIYIHKVSVNRRDTVFMQYLILNHNQNFITITFSGINFRDAGQLLYKYRLIGLSENWVYSRNVQVEYAFLPSGIYKFEVYAINSEGKISNQPAILEFRILPPFWKTWWFISAVIFTILFLFYTYFNLRIQTLRKQHNLQNDINKYREQALIRQMDPHFVFNSLNSIQSFIIKNDSVSSSHYLSKFARLMRIILNNSQKQAVRLSDEIDALSLYMELESMRFKQKFEHKITVDPTIETELIFIPAFLVQPFIENAIWHGMMHLEKPGFIHINYILGDSQIICTIEDNGIGRVKSSELKSENDKKRKSMGVAIVESRLNVLSDFYKIKMKVVFTDVYDANNLPAGTRVTINLPIVKSEVFIK